MKIFLSKKIALLIILGILFPIHLSAPHFAKAQSEVSKNEKSYDAIEDYTLVSSTVKIIAYDFTYAGDIFPYAEGSGTIINPQGLILTNNHVVQDFKERELSAFLICLSEKLDKEPICEYTAAIKARDLEKDIALLQLDATDIRGNKLHELPYLDYQIETEPKVGDQIKVIGYPDIGGNTITTTQGVISGFSQSEQDTEVKYIKTDTKISSGNSGGTMIDANGNFIGVPTSIALSYETTENLGNAIDIRSIKSWISEHVEDPINPKNFNTQVKDKMILLNNAEFSHILNYPFYPAFTLKKSENWHFDQIEKSYVSLYYTQGDLNFSIYIDIERLPFHLDQSNYIKSVIKDIEKDRDQYSGYKRQNINFAGTKAISITRNFFDAKRQLFLIPYGYAIITIRYQLDLKNESRDLSYIQKVLDSFTFIDSKKGITSLSQYKVQGIGLGLKKEGNFFIQSQENYYDKNTIVKLVQPDNYKGKFDIWYDELDESQKQETDKKLLQLKIENLKYLEEYTLINQSDKLIIDGLPGYAITYSYKGEDYQETRKTSELFLRDQEKYFSITYDDEEKSYDKNKVDVEKILRTLTIDRSQEQKGTYIIPPLDFVFIDIANHRFISQISSMRDRGLMKGFDDNTFRPEEQIKRAEALTVIIDSKLFSKNKKKSKLKELDLYKSHKYRRLSFKDHGNNEAITKYIRYARDKKIISGFPDNTFRTNDPISLAEILAILFKTHELKTWQPLSDQPGNIPWYKPYMDKAFQLGILPDGLFDPLQNITRAELAYIVDTLLTQMEE